MDSRAFFMSFFKESASGTFAAWDHMQNVWQWRRTGTAGEAKATRCPENDIHLMLSLREIPA